VILAALFGVAAPLYSLTPPGVLGYWEEGADLAYQYTNYDPEKSRSLLKEAGWVDTDGDGICEKNGEKLDLVFFAFNIARYRRIAEVVEPMLEEVGFNVQIMVLEPGDLYERVIRGEHDLLSTAWMGIGLVQDLLFPTCHSDYLGTKTNWFLFSNPEFDAAMSLSLSALDDTERRRAVYKAQEVVIKAALCAPVASPLDMFGYKSRIGGVDEYMEHPWAFARDDAIKALLLYIK
jgi:peptide/nickel transport system substrate-binding protein